jgi:hypothetical protein
MRQYDKSIPGPNLLFCPDFRECCSATRGVQDSHPIGSPANSACPRHPSVSRRRSRRRYQCRLAASLDRGSIIPRSAARCNPGSPRVTCDSIVRESTGTSRTPTRDRQNRSNSFNPLPSRKADSLRFPCHPLWRDSDNSRHSPRPMSRGSRPSLPGCAAQDRIGRIESGTGLRILGGLLRGPGRRRDRTIERSQFTCDCPHARCFWPFSPPSSW